jgi:hypothetical protein
VQAVLALLLLAQPGGLDLPPAEKQKRIALIEARTEKTQPPSETITIEAGDTVFVRASIPVDDARGVLNARATGVRTGTGMIVARQAEVVDQEPGAVVVVYAVEVSPRRAPGSDILEATLEVRDEGGARVARRSIAHEVIVQPFTASAEEIALDRDAVLHHRSLASARNVEEKDALHHRLRAQAARRCLIAAANAEDRALELAAIRAIGSLSSGPRAAKETRQIDELTTEAALELAANALDRLALEEAQGIVTKLRRSGRLEKRELALALQILAAIEIARDDEDDAERLFGQAFCADPGRSTILRRRAFLEAFEAAKQTNLCREPIRIGEVHVFRDQGEDGLIYLITATYGDDPFALVEGGDLEIWGTGGGIFAKDRVRSTEKNGQKILIGEIEDNGKMETYAGQILVKVFLRDSSGVVIDSFGDPDPVSLPIEEGENLPSVSIPWWVWVVAGVAVAGAATATAIVLTRPEESELGIGPIEVTF